eukprot:CAMPEP_0204239732 /NCGR_PEP_ID=MMETSP0361-20130328/94528_1 /ASSEMBLY_ACC=CAM_ASM_000343 /TAXON_ID=268821 /ORGANISM="Scrippsiella Hangoei, Strain SHTV-5" /LENGTH=127 /DNA_ID=CAMNT_0051212529 /DNA_START=27 /DNA_END=410 /DNA_ORIENTATION=-
MACFSDSTVKFAVKDGANGGDSTRRLPELSAPCSPPQPDGGDDLGADDAQAFAESLTGWPVAGPPPPLPTHLAPPEGGLSKSRSEVLQKKKAPSRCQICFPRIDAFLRLNRERRICFGTCRGPVLRA